MRFLVDACTGPVTARWLHDQQHDVFSVYDEAPEMEDSDIIHKAIAEKRIIITNDKDFGEKIYREGYAHHGVILLRLLDERTPNKIATLQRFLVTYADQIEGQFVVVTEQRVRFARSPS